MSENSVRSGSIVRRIRTAMYAAGVRVNEGVSGTMEKGDDDEGVRV